MKLIKGVVGAFAAGVAAAFTAGAWLGARYTDKKIKNQMVTRRPREEPKVNKIGFLAA